MSSNFPDSEVDPSEGTLEGGPNFDEGAAAREESQVDPSEDPE